jgi:transcriptional regulator with GAF, ATPase, and Fis domain
MENHTESFFREATLRICSSLDIATAMGRCFEYLKEYIPINGLGIQVYEPNTNTSRNLITINKGHVENMEQIIPIPKSAWQVSKEKWPRLPEITITSAKGPFGPNVIRRAFQFPWKDFSCMVVMLELDNERLGVLGLYTPIKNQYSKEHVDFVKMLIKPFTIAVSNYLRYQEVIRLKDMLADDNRFLRQEVLGISEQEIIGHENGLKQTMQLVRLISTLDTQVLLLGETGVGKEVIANAIHFSSSRKEGPFIKVNCGAMPEGLLDSELFGHEKGAFTGATSQKRGRFERANGGTIFLDEIGEMSALAQVRLLRVLQENEIERVGGTRSIKVDVRIIVATHRTPEEMVKAGTFREDLLFRINTFPIWIPPLRERKEDIPLLVDHFLKIKSGQFQIVPVPEISPNTLDKIISHHWPGNVRELENAVARALIHFRGLGKGSELTFEDFGTSAIPTLPKITGPSPGNMEKPLSLKELNRQHIVNVLSMTQGKIFGPGGAAEMLDINPNTLRTRMRKLGIRLNLRKVEKI